MKGLVFVYAASVAALNAYLFAEHHSPWSLFALVVCVICALFTLVSL